MLLLKYIVLCTAVLGLMACLESESETKVSVNIVDADIFIDGKKRAVSSKDGVLVLLTEGKHQVRVSKKTPEWMYWGEKIFFVNKDMMNEVSVPLERFATQKTLNNLKLSQNKVKIQLATAHQKNRAQIKKIKKYKNAAQPVSPPIIRSPVVSQPVNPPVSQLDPSDLEGQLKITSNISGADIFIDGKKRAVSTNSSVLILVEEGNHKLSIKKYTKDWVYSADRDVYVGKKTIASFFVPVKKAATKGRLEKIRREQGVLSFKQRKAQRKYKARIVAAEKRRVAKRAKYQKRIQKKQKPYQPNRVETEISKEYTLGL